MTSTGGQSLIPYPWSERQKFNTQRKIIAPIVKVTSILAIIATVLSPPTIIAWLWSRFSFRRYNESWSKRGLILLLIGVISAALITPHIVDVPLNWYAAFKSLTKDDPADPTTTFTTAIITATPWALILHGLHSLTSSYQIEVTTDSYLRKQRPTLNMKLRARRNTAQLRSGIDRHRKKGYVRFGVITGDRIPWRRSRYGQVVERPIRKMGHGVFIGANGRGKTKAAESFAHYVLDADGAMIYIDFKASLATMTGLAGVARADDKPCYILDIGAGSKDTSWYDLFAWPGSPSDKASVLVECFQFPEGDGGSAYYRNLAEAWLGMQLEAAEHLTLQPGEGMFDYLLDTSSPSRLQERITPLRESTDQRLRDKYEQWNAEADRVKPQELQGLRSELNKIVNAAGDRLKPNTDNPHPVSMKEVMDNGGLVYIGIASGINDTVVKVLGSFLFKELSILVSARARENEDTLRDVFVIPDEASEMEERSVMLNPIYTMAREARIYIWPSFQSYGDWDPSTQDAIGTNANNFVAFTIPSTETATKIAESLTDIFALKQQSQEQTTQRTFQNQSVGIGGDARLEIVTDMFLRPKIELSSVPFYHAYIWFMDNTPVSRDRWHGRRRVKKDETISDAPLVKLIPYDLVMPEGADATSAVIGDTPPAPQHITIDADDTDMQDVISDVPQAADTPADQPRNQFLVSPDEEPEPVNEPSTVETHSDTDPQTATITPRGSDERPQFPGFDRRPSTKAVPHPTDTATPDTTPASPEPVADDPDEFTSDGADNDTHEASPAALGASLLPPPIITTSAPTPPSAASPEPAEFRPEDADSADDDSEHAEPSTVEHSPLQQETEEPDQDKKGGNPWLIE